VAQYLIDHDLEPEFVRLEQQLVEIGQSAEQRVDFPVVGNVVAIIRHRRLEEGRHPDGVHAEAGDVLQPANDARQIAYAIAIGVLKAARVDLVDDRPLPPLLLLMHF